MKLQECEQLMMEASEGEGLGAGSPVNASLWLLFVLKLLELTLKAKF